MKTYTQTHIFNFKLFIEGLKRLKVFTTATAILSVTLSLLLPIISWMEGNKQFLRYGKQDPKFVDYYALVIPIYLVVFIAPFMILKIFSYLHKRKESDFFHAVPYTRTCVYVSFTLSALTSVFGIILLSGIAAGLCWGLSPYTYFNIVDLIVQLLVCMLASSVLCSIMATAVMMTGTHGVAVGLFTLFCSLWRYILYLFEGSINYYVICTDALPYLNWDWFLPFRLFTATFDSYQTYGDRFSLAQIIYHIILTILFFTIAGFLYQKRQSEMAGNAAPNRIMQHVYRCLFTLPVLMLMPYFALCDNEFDFVTNFIIVVVSLLIYYLYELITTKSFKGFLRATPWLGVLAVVVLLFFGVHSGIKQVILYEDIDKDEIAWVQFEEGSDVFDGYQLYLMGNDIQNTCDNEEVISFVANALHESQMVGRTNDLSDYIVYDYCGTRVLDKRIVTTRVKLKSGRIITRDILYHDVPLREILSAYAQDITRVDITALPPKDQIESIRIKPYVSNGQTHDTYNLDTKAIRDAFLKTFIKEYEALSPEEIMVLREAQRNNRSHQMSLYQSIHIVEIRFYVTSNQPLPHQVSQSLRVYVTKEKFPEIYQLSYYKDVEEAQNDASTEEVTEK